MKKFLIMVLAALGMASCAGDMPFRSVDVDEFKEVIAQPGTQLVDVRTFKEYAAGHIQGSVNIDVNDATFSDVVQGLLDKERTVAVYCRSGRRSKIASEELVKLGYTNVKEFGGIIDWPYETTTED